MNIGELYIDADISISDKGHSYKKRQLIHYNSLESTVSPNKDEYMFRVEKSSHNNTKVYNSYIVTKLDDCFFREFDKFKLDGTIHEVLFRSPRKLVYDVDFIYDGNLHPWDIVTNIIFSSIDIIQEYYNFKINPTEFLIFESNGNIIKDKVSIKKYSYHIVLISCHFNSYVDCLFIASEVIKKHPELSSIIDNIYSLNKCLRVLHSSKISDPDRVKKFVSKYKLKDSYVKQIFDPRQLFRHSLVSDIGLSPRIFNTVISDDELENMMKVKHDIIIPESDEIDVEKVIEYLYEYFSPETFSIGNIRKNYKTSTLVNLITESSYYCPICDRVHDSQNPHIVISTFRNTTKYYFKCKRFIQECKLARINSESINLDIVNKYNMFMTKIMDLDNIILCNYNSYDILRSHEYIMNRISTIQRIGNNLRGDSFYPNHLMDNLSSELSYFFNKCLSPEYVGTLNNYDSLGAWYNYFSQYIDEIFVNMSSLIDMCKYSNHISSSFRGILIGEHTVQNIPSQEYSQNNYQQNTSIQPTQEYSQNNYQQNTSIQPTQEYSQNNYQQNTSIQPTQEYSQNNYQQNTSMQNISSIPSYNISQQLNHCLSSRSLSRMS